jgi:hypothetical protein
MEDKYVTIGNEVVIALKRTAKRNVTRLAGLRARIFQPET